MITSDWTKTNRFFIDDCDGKIWFIARLGELRDFEAQFNNSAATLKVFDVRLRNSDEVNDTSVWRVQSLQTLCNRYTHTIDTNHSTTESV